MPWNIDFSYLIGTRSGGLEITGVSVNKGSRGKTLLDASCSYCGKQCEIVASDMTRKDEKRKPKSCGCQKVITSLKNLATKSRPIEGESEVKFRMNVETERFEPVNLEHRKKERLYSIWKDIKKRCYNEKSFGYRWYGALGIVMCDEWKDDYAAFKKWALNSGYHEDLSIERLNTSIEYQPNNCCWISRNLQGKNKKNTRFFMDKETGKKLTIPEIADVVGMKKSVMYHRFYKHGVSAFGNRFEEIPRNA
jgi:hypothetical protein